MSESGNLTLQELLREQSSARRRAGEDEVARLPLLTSVVLIVLLSLLGWGAVFRIAAWVMWLGGRIGELT